ncbi:MAG: hypothetical protein LBP75_03660 [Planctomycetota bacterium]|nr:hypothetical protein [Planctomycetota bacterium]
MGSAVLSPIDGVVILPSPRSGRASQPSPKENRLYDFPLGWVSERQKKYGALQGQCRKFTLPLQGV